MSLLLTCAPVLVGYLLGSIPFGYLAGRIAKIDIRQHGSGNIGATNVVRVLGKPWGYAVFALDFCKGVAAVFAVPLLRPHALTAVQVLLPPFTLQLLAGVAAVVGHAFPVWLAFRGGKAVATSLGVVFALAPLSALTVIVIWVLTFVVSRYVSVASLAAATALPILNAFIGPQSGSARWLLTAFFALLATLIWVRHRSNIARLIAGTEPRFTRK